MDPWNLSSCGGRASSVMEPWFSHPPLESVDLPHPEYRSPGSSRGCKLQRRCPRQHSPLRQQLLGKPPILLRTETLDQPIRMVSRVSICTCRSCLLDLAFLAVLHRANLKQFKFKSFAAKIWDVTVKLKVQIQRLQT